LANLSPGLDAPAVVARALRRGWTTARIVNAYPVSSASVRLWRWRMQLVSADAQACARRAGVPVEAIGARLAQGTALKQACAELGADWQRVNGAAWQGAWLYPPRERGYPCPRKWHGAARRYASALRRELGREMLQAGLSAREVSEIVGVTPRAVRMWRNA